MTYWYYFFQGLIYEEEDYKNLYSSVLLPVRPNENPKERLTQALKEYGVTLTKIEDSFEFIATDYDPNDKDNQAWFDWFEQVSANDEAKFTPWQRYR